MSKKTVNQLIIFVAAGVFLLTAILYFAGAGTARMVAESIDKGVNTLVENQEGTSSDIALILSAIGVGTSIAIVYVLRVLGVIHIIGSLFTALQGVIVRVFDVKGKHKIARGFTIWALVRFAIYLLVHIIVMVFAGINVRSIVFVIGIAICFIASIVAMASDRKKKVKELGEFTSDIHM